MPDVPEAQGSPGRKHTRSVFLRRMGLGAASLLPASSLFSAKASSAVVPAALLRPSFPPPPAPTPAPPSLPFDRYLLAHGKPPTQPSLGYFPGIPALAIRLRSLSRRYTQAPWTASIRTNCRRASYYQGRRLVGMFPTWRAFHPGRWST